MTYQYFSELRHSFAKQAKATVAPHRRPMEKTAFRNILKHLFDPTKLQAPKMIGKGITDIGVPAAVANVAYSGDESWTSNKLPGLLKNRGFGGGYVGRPVMEEYITNAEAIKNDRGVQPIMGTRPQTVGGLGETPTGARSGLGKELAVGLAGGTGMLLNPRLYTKALKGGLRELKPKHVEGTPEGWLGKSEGTDFPSGALAEIWPGLRQKGIAAGVATVPTVATMVGESHRATEGAGNAMARLDATMTKVDNLTGKLAPKLERAVDQTIANNEIVGDMAVAAATDLHESVGSVAEVMDIMQTEFPKLFEAFERGGGHMRAGMERVGGGMDRLTQMLTDTGRTAAPMGAGALGGYVLANLLGKKRPKRESEHDREKREKHQHLINLLGAAGGGALGFYMKNKLDPAVTPAIETYKPPEPSTTT